jgi:molybdopterin molybdotransferase
MAVPLDVEVSEALQIVLAAVHPLAAEPVAVAEALGRVSAQHIQAAADVPGFRSAAMDGYAIRAQDTIGASRERPAVLPVVGESRAGRPAATAMAAGHAMAISTGAEIPAGADAVVRFERTLAARAGSVAVGQEIPPGADLRGSASEIATGTLLMRRGARLSATGIGALAALGHETADCARRPRVSVVATGDELVSCGAELGPGQLYDSNSHVLAALVLAAGATVARRETAADDPDALRGLLGVAGSDSDVLVLSGGVSRGVHDHVRPSLDALGARPGFWGMNVRPGAPTWFGVLGNTLVFALPGNPVAAITTFALLVTPALAALQGLSQPEPLHARLDGGYEKSSRRAHALPCTLRVAPDGLHAVPTRERGARGLGALQEADCVVLIPATAERLEPGAEVWVARLPTGGPTLPV